MRDNDVSGHAAESRIERRLTGSPIRDQHPPENAVHPEYPPLAGERLRDPGPAQMY